MRLGLGLGVGLGIGLGIGIGLGFGFGLGFGSYEAHSSAVKKARPCTPCEPWAEPGAGRRWEWPGSG